MSAFASIVESQHDCAGSIRFGTTACMLRLLDEAGGVLERVQWTSFQFPLVQKTVRRALLHRFRMAS